MDWPVAATVMTVIAVVGGLVFKVVPRREEKPAVLPCEISPPKICNDQFGELKESTAVLDERTKAIAQSLDEVKGDVKAIRNGN